MILLHTRLLGWILMPNQAGAQRLHLIHPKQDMTTRLDVVNVAISVSEKEQPMTIGVAAENASSPALSAFLKHLYNICRP